MWYLLFNNRAFCIYLFLCKASVPTCRGSTDQAASNSWILKTAVFKCGLRFLGAAYSYRLPPASTGLRFHSRCSHTPCPTYWHMWGGRVSCQGKLKMQDTPPANPFPPKSQPPHIQQRITRGKKQNLKFWKRSFLDTVCATTIVTWDKSIGKSIETSCHRGLPRAILPLPFQGHCPWLFLLAGLQVPSFGLLAHKSFFAL